MDDLSEVVYDALSSVSEVDRSHEVHTCRLCMQSRCQDPAQSVTFLLRLKGLTLSTARFCSSPST
jgi:hypothetical protein